MQIDLAQPRAELAAALEGRRRDDKRASAKAFSDRVLTMVGTVDGNMVVITSGLQAGQKVVAAGVHVLTAGQKVALYVDPAAPADPAASTPAMPATGR